jgi:hypothetical protein
MPWKTIFAAGAFGGTAPILLQLAIDLTQGRKKVEAIGLSILVGMLIYAALGGGLSLIWKETDLKKVFYIGLGLPSLLTIASGNLTAPQLPTTPLPPSPTTSAPRQPPGAVSSSHSDTNEELSEKSFNTVWRVYAQVNIANRQLIVDLDPGAVPAEVSQSPLNVVFEPSGSYATVQYGKAITSVPATATSFRIEGSLASSASIDLPSTAGSITRVRVGAEKRAWYGLLYSLGARFPPYQLIKKSTESTLPVTDPNDSIASQIQPTVKAKPIHAEQGQNRYEFTLSLEAPNNLKDDIARVDYDLIYDPNPLLLVSNDKNTNFEAKYQGWGCYSHVEAVVSFKSVNTQPRKKAFDMCVILGW